MNTKGFRLNPVVLILINIVAPSMYIFLPGKYLQYFLLAFALSVMLLAGSIKGFFGLLLVEGLFLAIFYGTIGVSSLEFLGLFFIVFAQSVPCVALAILLIKRYDSAELLSALETLHIPRVLVVAVTITLKYIPTFRREFSYIKESMRLRGISFTWKRPVKSFQYFIVPQLFRCSALAEEVSAAGLVKGIDAPIRRSSYFEQKFHVMDGIVLLVFIGGLVGGFVWKNM
ncbi:MAG: energy-coupling factor transporter transmembrane protein EcfT [Lachnospiraceae bacterium]|nr:energy-coupling factor transporter transmembrane protein EcfT [Lachnospiraceae bacterium]